MAKTTVLLPEELTKMNAVIVKRDSLEHIAGMIEAASYTAPSGYQEMLVDIVERLDEMLNNRRD